MQLTAQQAWILWAAQNNQQLQAAAAAERAAIVAWLRQRPGYGPVADAIERGEHGS